MKWTSLSDEQERKRWWYADGSSQAEQVRIMEAEFCKKVKAVQKWLLRRKQNWKTKWIWNCYKIWRFSLNTWVVVLFVWGSCGRSAFRFISVTEVKKEKLMLFSWQNALDLSGCCQIFWGQGFPLCRERKYHISIVELIFKILFFSAWRYGFPLFEDFFVCLRNLRSTSYGILYLCL